MMARQLPGVMWSTLITVQTALSHRTTWPFRISVACNSAMGDDLLYEVKTGKGILADGTSWNKDGTLGGTVLGSGFGVRSEFWVQCLGTSNSERTRNSELRT